MSTERWIKNIKIIKIIIDVKPLTIYDLHSISNKALKIIYLRSNI